MKAQCKFGKQLWHHILHCTSSECEFPRCTNSKELLKHHQKCQVRTPVTSPSPILFVSASHFDSFNASSPRPPQDARCPICVPVKQYVKRTRAQQNAGQANQMQQQPDQMQPHMSRMPQFPSGMVPNPGSGLVGGMVPNPVGMPGLPGGMVPNPVGMPGLPGGMVPNPGIGMMPNPGMMQPYPMHGMQHMMPGGMQQQMHMVSGQKRPHIDAFGTGAFSAGAAAAPTFAGGLVPGMRGENKKMRADDVICSVSVR